MVTHSMVHGTILMDLCYCILFKHKMHWDTTGNARENSHWPHSCCGAATDIWSGAPVACVGYTENIAAGASWTLARFLRIRTTKAICTGTMVPVYTICLKRWCALWWTRIDFCWALSRTWAQTCVGRRVRSGTKLTKQPVTVSCFCEHSLVIMHFRSSRCFVRAQAAWFLRWNAYKKTTNNACQHIWVFHQIWIK